MTAIASDVVTELKRRLVDGLQVLTGEGVLGGAGHLSVRVPGTETFLINPRYPAVLADPEDICTVDMAAKRIAGPGPIPSETVIHSAIYKRRPDIKSVLHCHPRHAVMVGLLDSGFIPINREAKLFADGVPVMPEGRNIDTPELAEQMAEVFGNGYAMFLRGHGIVVGGPSIEGTCVSAIALEDTCADQLLLMSFMTPKPLQVPARGRVEARLENPYRIWPFLLYKHGVRSKEEIKSMLNVPKEGEIL